MPKHLLLIDASGFAHRAYHAGSAHRFRSDGLPTWAIEGFLGLMWRLLGSASHDPPDLAVAAFDAPGKTFRHDLFPAYKSNRPARDQELAAQLPYMRVAAEAMGLTPSEAFGYEADDVICTLANQAVERGHRVTIVSSDKDYCQMVCDGKVVVVDPSQGGRIDEAYVRGVKFGVEPRQVPDFQGLVGDDVDNIPGVDGIGPKNGAAFIRMFDTVEGVVKAANDRPAFFTPSQRVRLKDPAILPLLKLYRTLATLRADVPVELDEEAMETRDILKDSVMALLTKLEAAGRFQEIFRTDRQTHRQVEALSIGAQLEWWEEELEVPGQPIPDLPQCGYYERRLVKGGVFVPVTIWRDTEIDPITGKETGMHVLRCMVGDQEADAVHEWPKVYKNPITHEKYRFKMADLRWAKQFAPDDPHANPHKAVDFNCLPAPNFAR